jgi:hypothetical protein
VCLRNQFRAILAPNLRDVIFSLTLHELSLARLVLAGGGRVQAAMSCQKMSFDYQGWS